uniref:NADH dehydrogenase subunit 4L n=1 Tax=Clavularia inflata TaxID=360968 RepID=UPI001FAF28AD|nr:NADH dehydrogenase subunit 4L [Clavularia inflata]UEK21456.1 NADH dehydrogenase subunit 4L [Clavularia sp. AP-2020]UEK21470.1 NADH dehydrogenase subunit 4L [Clavularia sp. AP-2020]UKP87517.1 NADH dehydrogenase subunit 4L [Clavularia inflata]
MSYLILSIVILLIGILGIILNRSNLIIMLMCVELVLLASTILLLFESRVLYTLFGQIFTIMILTVAAAESAIGLAIMVNYYRLRGTIAVRALNLLRG